jgi:hypothetical protein
LARKRKPRITRLVVVSDLHCGSVVGLCPPEWQLLDGTTYGSNLVQRWSWNCWRLFDRWLTRTLGDAENTALVLNGDLVEGRHHRTMELVHHDITEHQRLATAVLSSFARRFAKVFIARGTECHARTLESSIGDDLILAGIPIVPCPSTGDPCHEVLTLDINGVRTSVSHHAPCSFRPWTAGGGLSSSLTAEQANAAKMGYEIPRVVIRSHRHTYDYYGNAGGLIFTTPPWQGLTTWAKGRLAMTVNAIGGLLLDYSDAALEENNGLPRHYPKLFTPSPDKAIKL